MSGRELPGIHEAPKRGVRWGWVAAVIAAVALPIGCTAISSMNREPYDPNNSYEAIAQCEAAVKENLKAPATADFSSTATGFGTWTVTGTVDSENSFGAKVRSSYECTVIVEGESIRVRVDSLE